MLLNSPRIESTANYSIHDTAPVETPTPFPHLSLLWSESFDYIEQGKVTIDNGIVYAITISTDPARCNRLCHDLTAFDLASGRIVRSFSDNEYPPSFANGVVYTGFEGIFSAIDITKQSSRWRFSANDTLNSANTTSYNFAPTIGGGVVYFIAGNTLYAVDTDTGQEKWRVQYGDNISSQPVLANGLVYVTADTAAMLPNSDVLAHTETLYATDVRYGQRMWDFTPSENHALGNPIAAPDGTIYISTGSNEPGYIYALSGPTGRERWTYAPESSYEIFHTDPILGEGILYFASFENGLYAIDAATGEKRWTAFVPNVKTNEIAFYEGSVYLAAIDGMVIVVDATTGEIKNRYRDNAQPQLKILQSNGRLYFVGQTTEALYAYVLPE